MASAVSFFVDYNKSHGVFITDPGKYFRDQINTFSSSDPAHPNKNTGRHPLPEMSAGIYHSMRFSEDPTTSAPLHHCILYLLYAAGDASVSYPASIHAPIPPA